MNKIRVPPEGWLAIIADLAMVPFMYLVSGTLSEKPQRTHRWNNVKLSRAEVALLDRSLMVHVGVATCPHARFWWKIPIFHMPIFGGWRNFMVFVPCSDSHKDWHIGWIAKDVCGATRINLRGPVRMLLGPGDVSFFGIDAVSGEQIPIQLLGRGSIWDEGPFSDFTLL